MKDDYKYETERYEPIDSYIDTHTTRIVKSYYQILGLMDNIDEYLLRAKEYPEGINADHAQQCQDFLEKVGEALQEYEPLFNELDE